MIKIQEHLNRPDADDFLDTLAIKMWEHLNVKVAGGDYGHYALINKLGRLIVQSKTPDYLLDYANNDNGSLLRHQAFFSYLEANDNEKLLALVTSRPVDLLILKREILNILIQDDLTLINGSAVEQTAFGKLLISSLFNYKTFRQSQLCFQLIIDANLEHATCPYCNENSISVVDISEEIDATKINKAYLDLDHFYPKAQHPYFALSYYNLIPCCHICNSSEKGDEEFCILTHQHPFQQSFNENYTFQINANTFVDGETDTLVLNKVIHRADYSERDLRLNRRYQKYLKETNDFISLYLKYYNSGNPYNFDWREAVLKDVPLEIHEILVKRLGKMYRDVFKEIDVDSLVND